MGGDLSDQYLCDLVVNYKVNFLLVYNFTNYLWWKMYSTLWVSLVFDQIQVNLVKASCWFKLNAIVVGELNANGKLFTLCDHVSYCESRTVRRNVFNWPLIISTIPLDHGAYGIRDLNCTLYVRQKCVNFPLMYSFPLPVTKISGIPNLTIQWSNNTVSEFVATFYVASFYDSIISPLVASFLGEGWRTT